MKQAAIYCRVSTSQQAETGTSLQSQLESCRAYAQEHGYSVALEAEDTYSGASTSRAGLQRVLAAARDGTVDAVVCYAIDRANRDLADLLVLNKQLEAAGVSLLFVRDPHERTPQGKLFMQMKGAFAEFERTLILQRTQDGKRARVKGGKVIRSGWVAYGYTWRDGTLEIDPLTGPNVALMYGWAEEGHNMHEIARRLTERGVPSPRAGTFWRSNTISRMLHNPVYKGQWAWNKWAVATARKPRPGSRALLDPDQKTSRRAVAASEWLYVEVPAIVSVEAWEGVQTRLALNKELSQRNRKREYLLAGLVRCANCHHKMVGSTPKKGTLYYRCSWDYHTCHAPSVQSGILDSVVWDEVCAQISDPDLMGKVERRAEALQEHRAHPDNRLRLTHLQTALQEVERDTSKLLDLYMTDDIDRPTFQARAALLRRRKEQIEAEQGALTREEAARTQNTASLIHIAGQLASVRERLHLIPFMEKRALLIAWNVRVEVDTLVWLASVYGLPLPAERIPIPRPVRKNARKAG